MPLPSRKTPIKHVVHRHIRHISVSNKNVPVTQHFRGSGKAPQYAPKPKLQNYLLPPEFRYSSPFSFRTPQEEVTLNANDVPEALEIGLKMISKPPALIKIRRIPPSAT